MPISIPYADQSTLIARQAELEFLHENKSILLEVDFTRNNLKRKWLSPLGH